MRKTKYQKPPSAEKELYNIAFWICGELSCQRCKAQYKWKGKKGGNSAKSYRWGIEIYLSILINLQGQWCNIFILVGFIQSVVISTGLLVHDGMFSWNSEIHCLFWYRWCEEDWLSLAQKYRLIMYVIFFLKVMCCFITLMRKSVFSLA